MDAASEANVSPLPPCTATAFVGDPYAHDRRETGRVDAGGLVLGASEPVRVELDLGGSWLAARDAGGGA